MLVGEQPGNEEDKQGHPFVGPAGALLERALEDAGIRRDEVYVTNAVKHFKWEPRGKRRIHKTPAQREIEACGQWLNAEISSVNAVDDRPIPCPGPITKAIAEEYAKAVRGKVDRYKEWVEHVS